MEKIGNITYYETRKECERYRKSGQRIYFTKGLGYYIIKPNENIFDSLIIEEKNKKMNLPSFIILIVWATMAVLPLMFIIENITLHKFSFFTIQLIIMTIIYYYGLFEFLEQK